MTCADKPIDSHPCCFAGPSAVFAIFDYQAFVRADA